MLEGLEISEVLLSRIPFENHVLRIDAEYFKKKYLIEDFERLKYQTVYLGNDYFITDGQHGYHEVDENSEIRHLTAKNFKNWFADDHDADRLANWVDNNNRRSSLKENDIVLTTRGSVGYCAIVKNEVLPANIDQDVARIAYLQNCKIIPQFLVAYMNSKFGQDWTNRNQTGMVQQGLALWRVRELPIPLLSNNFQNAIKEIVENAYYLKTDSHFSYNEAENLLNETIGLKNFQASSEPINIKGVKESFISTGRLDAEYYQKKYEDYTKLIQNYSNGFDKLSSICKIKDSNFNPKENEKYQYIELSDIDKFGKITSCTYALGAELPSRARRIVRRHDVIISSVEGSLESCGIVTDDYNYALCSTGFFVINSIRINSETLLVLFKSKLMQNVLKQNCSGTILTAINKTEFKNIPIPLIDNNIQSIIKTKINSSFSLIKQSETLLEIARQAVEIAIEKNEEIALTFIEKSKYASNN